MLFPAERMKIRALTFAIAVEVFWCQIFIIYVSSIPGCAERGSEELAEDRRLWAAVKEDFAAAAAKRERALEGSLLSSCIICPL